MRLFNQLAIVFIAGCMLAGPMDARTKKGEKFIKEGHAAQMAEDWDKALEAFEKALAEDPSDPLYQMAVRRMRFQSSQAHVKQGQQLRKQGNLEEALAEFQRAFALDPSSSIAEQELRNTFQMIQRDEESAGEGGQTPIERGMSPADLARKDAEDRISRIQPVPELKPISPILNTLKMNNQPVKVLFETVGKLAGINVVFDPDFQPSSKTHTVDLTNATLEEALRYLTMLTKTFWKPLSENTIFVTDDNATKRRDHEEMVVKVFYLKNITKQQELQEIFTAVRSVTAARFVFVYNPQNAIIARGTVDQVALIEKLIQDLDKPLAEVVVDIIVMEANRGRTRDLASSLMSGGTAGISVPLSFSPQTSSSGGTDGETTSGTSINLGQLRGLSGNDWSLSLPGALLQALMKDSTTRILQRPQIRAADGQPASLRLGDKYPYATGSFQPGVSGVGVNPLVSTQFQFADVGMNVDITPKIHGSDEVSMHIEIEVSSVREQIDIGGLTQPVIGQRTISEDIRVREGEVTLLGGLAQEQRTQTKTGVPGLGKIPIIKWLGFSNENKEHNEAELLIAMVPYIVRRPEITELNLRAVSAGSEQVVKLNYAPVNGHVVEPDEEQEPAAQTAPAAPATPTPGAPILPMPFAPRPAALTPKPAAPRAPAGSSRDSRTRYSGGNSIINYAIVFSRDRGDKVRRDLHCFANACQRHRHLQCSHEV